MSDQNIPTVDKKDLDNVRQLIENEIKQNKLAPLELTDIISNNSEFDDKYDIKTEDNYNHFILFFYNYMRKGKFIVCCKWKSRRNS